MTDRGALSPVRSWRIHLGAHKTATSHMQRTLLAHRDALVANGCDYLPVPELRPLMQPYVQPGSWKRRFWSPPVARRFLRDLDGMRRGPGTVLLSDEDLLGYARDQLESRLYPDFRALHLVRAMAARANETRLFLCVRAPHTLLPSAYAQALKAEPFAPGHLDRLAQRMQQTPPCWSELVNRIKTALPNLPLRIWRYEDYRTHQAEIIAHFVGMDPGALPEVPPVHGTTSPAPQAIAEAEILDKTLPQRDRILRIREIYATWPAGPEHGRMTPFSESAAAALQAHYTQDLDAIERQWPGTLLRPGAR